MIWITGDTHGDFHRLSSKNFPEQKSMTRDDFVIILGDFSGIFCGSKEENYWLDWLENKNYTTLFIDGNHDNFPLLETYPVVPFCGGLTHQIRPHVYHLCRSQLFQLDGQNFFVMGGAQSHDALILSPEHPNFRRKKKLYRKYRIPFRVIGENWWPEERPRMPEYLRATTHLYTGHWPEDCIILTHCAPTDIQQQFFPLYPQNYLTDFLMRIHQDVPYQHWFCGHYHQDLHLEEDRFTIVYQKMIQLTKKEGFFNE